MRKLKCDSASKIDDHLAACLLRDNLLLFSACGVVLGVVPVVDQGQSLGFGERVGFRAANHVRSWETMLHPQSHDQDDIDALRKNAASNKPFRALRIHAVER